MPAADPGGLIEYLIKSLLLIISYWIIGLIRKQVELFFRKINLKGISVVLTVRSTVKRDNKIKRYTLLIKRV